MRDIKDVPSNDAYNKMLAIMSALQPTRAQLIAERGLNTQYHYNAIQTWKVTAQGEVANVHA